MLEFYRFADIGWNKETAIKIVSVLGLGSIISFIVWVCHKIYTFGKIMQRLDSVEKEIKDVKKDVRTASKDLVKRIDDLMIAVAQNGLTEAHSPRQLAKEGKRILQESGIDAIVDDKFELIVRKVEEQKPENAYQAERAVIDVVRHLADDAVVREAVEEGAFKSGSLSSAVLYVGAIYIRDRVLSELSLSPEEIDKHDPDSEKE